jgi:thioredoxin reductase (NADPH)
MAPDAAQGGALPPWRSTHMNYEDVVAKHWDVAVVGGGPGGMGAALYASRADLSTLVIEQAFVGGLIAMTTDVENYPAFEHTTGMELAQQMEAQVKRFGTEIIYKEVAKLERAAGGGFSLQLGDGKTIAAASVVIASGSAPRRLPAQGEAQFYGKGVSYCATCDGAFYRGKEIVVVGGGESAFQEGHFLTQFGRQVTLVHRRSGFRATPLAVRRARESGKWQEKLGFGVEAIYGDEVVRGVKLKHVESGAVEDFPCDGVFGFIGYLPASAYAAGLVELDAEGYVVTDRRQRTSVTGVWAVGDIVQGALKQMVISAGAGATAAIDIREWLAEQRA